LGLKYGGVFNMFDYDNGDYFPKYVQYARLKIYNTTKGTSLFSLLYDTEKIIKGAKLGAEVSYIRDMALDFYGFNGKNSIINYDFVNHNEESYINKYFYNQQRKWFRARLDIHKKIKNSNLSIYGGLTYNSFDIEVVDFDRFKVPSGPNGDTPNTESLYDKFSQWNVIPQQEQDGGKVAHLSAGLIYDTRNSQLNCSDGIWFESYFMYAPDLFENKAFTKHILTFRQYIEFPKSEMIFSYRVSSQQKLSGDIPFYYLPVFFDSQYNQEGLGGAYTLRGASRNRIISDGFLLGNIELRKKLFSIPVFKLKFDIEASIFTDMATITQKYKINDYSIPEEYNEMFINDDFQRSYITFGPGIYIIYNTNNVISINYGFSNDRQLGSSGLYLGSAFMF